MNAATSRYTAFTATNRDWNLDKSRYIALLREYDLHRDPRELAAFITVVPIGE